MVDFIPLQGDDLGVLHSDYHRMVSTAEGDIVFSYTQRGKGMDCHFAARKTALRALKQTINSFCEWLSNNYQCECIFAVVNKIKTVLIE